MKKKILCEDCGSDKIMIEDIELNYPHCYFRAECVECNGVNDFIINIDTQHNKFSIDLMHE